MVAYSFQKQFVAPILSGIKRQTIRSERRRHARPGETLQLYTGMRTRHCTKIMPDPVCVGLDEVSIDLSLLAAFLEPVDAAAANDFASVVRMRVNGQEMAGTDREMYAVHDGFHNMVFKATGEPIPAWTGMVLFWAHNYGLERFDGVAIRWVPAS